MTKDRFALVVEWGPNVTPSLYFEDSLKDAQAVREKLIANDRAPRVTIYADIGGHIGLEEKGAE